MNLITESKKVEIEGAVSHLRAGGVAMFVRSSISAAKQL